MSEGGSKGSERYPGVAAGRFNDRVSGVKFSFRVALRENVECNPILNTSGQIELFALRIDQAVPALEAKFDGQQWCVAH